MSALANVIRQWMNHNGKGQNQLAHLADIQTSTLSYLMTKEDAIPRPETLKKLAAAMEIPGVVLTALLGYPVQADEEPGNHYVQLAHEFESFPWLAERANDLLRLPESEFQELMQYLAFRRLGQNADRSNP